MTRRSLIAATALTVSALGALTLPSVASADAGPASGPPVALRVPARTLVETYGKATRQPAPIGIRLEALGGPFEVWTQRASYDQPVTASWHSADGDVALPTVPGGGFAGLARFLTVRVTDVRTGVTRTTTKDACLDGDAQRVDPAAPAESPYPTYCATNPYSLGNVQGVQQGWAVPLLGYDHPLRLARGVYDVSFSVSPAYAAALGLDPDASVSTRVTVRPADEQPTPSPHRTGPHARRTTGAAAPHGHRLTAAQAQATTGPVPDLRSLPAWGIQVSPSGRYLQFSATVWNAGDSPLVVDGFRRDGEDEMDAYQYFFDASGQQTGYTPVGGMHWDPRPTHQHWHFEDFATYTLLDSQQQKVVRSRKEAFCLANTDAVDLTVPSAAWQPDNTDLATACGDHDSLSVREVLASGWGDTYGQFRAGQSFKIADLPNGTYYIEVRANPHGRLTEADPGDDVSLRKIVLGGTPQHRTVTVPQVGQVVEPPIRAGR